MNRFANPTTKFGERRFVRSSDDVPQRPKYRILHHDSRSHYGLQVADYCCWAIFRKHEHKDAIHYSGIKSAVWSEFDIFQSGTTYYYR